MTTTASRDDISYCSRRAQFMWNGETTGHKWAAVPHLLHLWVSNSRGVLLLVDATRRADGDRADRGSIVRYFTCCWIMFCNDFEWSTMSYLRKCSTTGVRWHSRPSNRRRIAQDWRAVLSADDRHLARITLGYVAPAVGWMMPLHRPTATSCSIPSSWRPWTSTDLRASCCVRDRRPTSQIGSTFGNRNKPIIVLFFYLWLQFSSCNYIILFKLKGDHR